MALAAGPQILDPEGRMRHSGVGYWAKPAFIIARRARVWLIGAALSGGAACAVDDRSFGTLTDDAMDDVAGGGGGESVVGVADAAPEAPFPMAPSESGDGGAGMSELGIDPVLTGTACVSANCLNGSVCIEQPGGYRCECLTGYSGAACETNVDDCAAAACQNGASCVDKVNGYTCSCAAGFSGEQCERAVSDCSSNPCLNGASCVNQGESYRCDCGTGYAGVNCEIDVDECSTNDCLNGAACIDSLARYTCQCRPGFSGDLCETNVNECANAPCLNGGACTDLLAAFSCDCEGTGFGGQRCQTDVNECQQNPCLNSGQCTNVGGSFSCSCVGTGFSGERCQTPIDDCVDNDCDNGACVDAINGYSCRCDTNFHGELCEIQTFQGLGVNPGGVGNCIANAISGDGTTFVGTCGGGISGAFKWTSQGYVNLSGNSSSASDVTQNGLVVVGSVRNADSIPRAARWIGNAAPELFAPDGADAAETWSLGFFVSADGGLIAGEVQPGDRLVAHTWRVSGLLPIRTILDARGEYADDNTRGMSGNGNFVFGVAEGPDAAWRWSASGIVPLLGLGGTERRPQPRGANLDGSVIVGTSTGLVVRWLNGSTSAQSLGVPGIGNAVSNDGNVIIGTSQAAAFIWTPSDSQRTIASLLDARGIDLTGWVLSAGVDVSMDGKVIAGLGTHDGVQESWIVRLP